MSIPIQFRRGTAAEWAAADPVLFLGELGLLISDDPDTQLMKMGNGVNTWSELPWASRGPRGFDFAYEWDGYSLGVKHSDEAEYTYVDLRGEQGASFQFQWEGTTLKVKTSDDAEYVSVDLVGPQGETGPQGEQGPMGEVTLLQAKKLAIIFG
jgi:hypothetical protein